MSQSELVIRNFHDFMWRVTLRIDYPSGGGGRETVLVVCRFRSGIEHAIARAVEAVRPKHPAASVVLPMSAEPVSDWDQLVIDANLHATSAKDTTEQVREAAEAALHELCHVDASMSERIQVAQRVAESIGHPWPPYTASEEETNE